MRRRACRHLAGRYCAWETHHSSFLSTGYLTVSKWLRSAGVGFLAKGHLQQNSTPAPRRPLCPPAGPDRAVWHINLLENLWAFQRCIIHVCTVGAVSKARLSMKKSSFEYEKGQFEYEKGRPKTDPPFFIDLGGLPWCMIPRWKDLAISNTMVAFILHKYAFKVTISFEYEKVLCFSLVNMHFRLRCTQLHARQ